MAVAVYARQSVEKKNSISIEGQIELCKQTAGTEDVLVYEDRGYSGKNTERPAFQRLMKDVKEGKIERIYVYRLDRFSRSVADFGRLWETLKANSVEFVSVNENFDTSTPMGRAMLHIIMVFAQLERETTAERVKDNYYRRVSLGAWPGGPAPFGFTIGRAPGANGRLIPTLQPNENAETVLRIFQEYAKKDATLGTIARLLTQEGVQAAKRETWDNVSVARILHSPTYVMADEQVYLFYKGKGVNIATPLEGFDGIHGAVLVGKRDMAARKYTDVQNHTLSVLGSVGFVPSDLWLACQHKLQNNKQLCNMKQGKYSWLTGILKCEDCGYSLKITHSKGHLYLVCSGRYNMYKCDSTIRVKVEELEHHVQKELEALLDETPDEIIENKRVDDYSEQLEELDRRADRLMDAFSKSMDMPPAYLRRALARLEDERESLLQARQREQNRPVLPQRLDFSKLSFEEKKIVAAQYIRCIKVGENSAEICWNV